MKYRPPAVRIWHAVRPWSVTQRSGAASAACRGSPESRRAGLPLGDEFPCSPGAMSAVLPKLVALLRLEKVDIGFIEGAGRRQGASRFSETPSS